MRAADNLLVISRAPNGLIDDVFIDGVTLDLRSNAEVLGAATLAVTVREDATTTPLPCRLTLVDRTGAFVPLLAATEHPLAVRTGVIYTGNGNARFTIAPGDYTLHASRDVATMRCLDCRQEMTGTYEEIVTWWKWHVSIQESKP